MLRLTRRLPVQRLSSSSSSSHGSNSSCSIGVTTLEYGSGRNTAWFSTMKDLLDSFDKKPASSSVAKQASTRGDSSKKKDVLKFSQVMSGNTKFSLNDVPSSSGNSSSPIVGVSLRDSFRRVEQHNKNTKDNNAHSRFEQRNHNNNHNNNHGKTVPMRTSDFSRRQKAVEEISKDILSNVTASNLGKYSSAISEVEEKEVTPGDLRFKQLQQKMHHKKKKLNEKYPMSNSNAPVTNNATAPQQQQQQQQQSPFPRRQHNNHPQDQNSRQRPNQPNQHDQNRARDSNTRTETVPNMPESTEAAAPQILDIKDYIKEYKKKIEQKGSNPASSGGGGGRNNNNHASFNRPAPPTPKANNIPKGPTTIIKEVTIPSEGLLLRELASKLSLKISDVKAKLVEVGEMDDAEQDESKRIDADVVELLVLELGFSPKRVNEKFKAMAQSVKMADLMPSLKSGVEDDVNVVKRNPTVCVMGLVDHGKTTLLDALRKAKDKGKVAGNEAGGITQKLSAFTVSVRDDEKVVFLDTPGHAAFSAMRGQGAMATDIAVLVVALDDGVQPQTVEALKCAKNAKCSIVVALNKADKYPNETERSRARSRVLAQLAQHDVLTEEYGGDVQVVEVAGRTGEGIENLVESIMVQAEIMELKACTQGQAEAVVLDAHMEKGRGIVADILVKWGALSIGDPVVVGCSFGRIKSMIDDNGKSIKKALPSQPVRLLGLRSIPNTGAELLSVENESKAKLIAERRIRLAELRQAREQNMAAPQNQVEVDENGEPIIKPVVPCIGVLIKADGLGSLDALKTIVSNISQSTNEVQVKVLGESVGDVTLSDVERASAVGEALVLGFNVGIADNNTKTTAKQLDVSIHKDEVIYRLEDELVKAVENLLPKDRIVTKEGSAKVLKVFKLKDRKNTVVAGLSVNSGKPKCGGNGDKYVFKVLRHGQVILEENIGEADLKRFKDSVNEVDSGNECGLSLDGFHDFLEGDEIECYQISMQQRSLALSGYVSSRISTGDASFAQKEATTHSSNKKTQKVKM